jgi:class 3 adenylate cyclase
MELTVNEKSFLFADIEGSTELLERVIDGDFAAALSMFLGIVGGEVAIEGGQVVETDGDGVFAVFDDPSAALRAAVGIQHALQAGPLAHGVELRARIGIHAGGAVATSGTYVGLEVHRAARIGAAGHGGQILLSEVVARRVASLGPELPIRRLGSFRLKGLSRAERIHQLEVPGLPTEFPPLRAQQLPAEVAC